MTSLARRHVGIALLSLLVLGILGLSFEGCGSGAEAVVYSVSGTITVGGEGLAGVSVTATRASALSRATSGSATTDASGSFTVSNLDPGDYTITPSRTGYTFTPASAAVTIAAQNVTGTNFTATQTSTGDTGTVTGTVYGPDGSTPVVNAYVYVPAAGATAAALPSDASEVWTQTNAEGVFTLAGVPTGSTTLKIAKGDWTKTFSVDVVGGQTTTAPAASTTLPTTGEGAAKMAVVTGSYDRMQDVLAKLGFGEIDSTSGMLIEGTEEFDIYNGVGGEYGVGSIEDLLTNATTMAQYSTIFLNCGCSEELLDGDQRETVLANIRAYVQNGGSFYVTDLAYDYVEQAFPAAIDYVGSSATPTDTPEDMGDAEVGTSEITTEATVLDDTLRSWLDDRGALNADDTIHIAGFMSGWVVMNGVGVDTTRWTEGSIKYDDYEGGTGTRTEVKTLTVSFSHGSGKVIYSSYHTVEEDFSPTLHPQEWILSYLVFEAL